MNTIKTETSDSLVLNILEIIPNKGELNISCTSYKDNAIKDYRERYPEYYFHREDNYIYAWSIKPQPTVNLPDEFVNKKIARKENTLIFNKVIESGIVQYFKNINYKIYKLKYSSIYEVEFAKEKRDFSGLRVIPVLNLSIHPFFSKQAEKLVAALSLHVSQKFIFTLTEEQLTSNNIDTRNWKRNHHGDVTASRDNVATFLKATGQVDVFNNYVASINTNEYTYAKLFFFTKLFQDKFREKIYLPDGLTIDDFAFHKLPNSNFNFEPINKPKYYFYQERNGFGKPYNLLTKELKPYSFDYFNNELLKFLVIAPDTHEGTTETFIKNLQQRLADVFSLNKLHFEYLTFDSKKETYESVLSKHDCDKYHLAIVVVSQLEKVLPKVKAPYYITKAKLLNERVPTQEITVEVMRKADNLIYEAIALNIYSKLGGIAWTVEKVQKEKVEMIMGISSTINYDKERIIGFANIFDYNGNYLIGDCSTVSDFGDYRANLETYLTDAIKNIISIKNIQKGESFRLIFHLSKEAGKDNEIKAIENALQKFKEYDIQYGIVHLSYNHNLRLYSNAGKDYPKRGIFVQVSTFQALRHLGKPTKIPILIRLDKRSTFKDIYDISKQVLHFCHLCYRSFRPADRPVTIKYPALMSKLTEELGQVPRWNPDQLNKVKDKLWFI